MDDQTLEEKIAMLRKQQKRARELGLRGENLATRVEDDIRRIINSGWLNLYEYCEEMDRKSS